MSSINIIKRMLVQHILELGILNNFKPFKIVKNIRYLLQESIGKGRVISYFKKLLQVDQRL